MTKRKINAVRSLRPERTGARTCIPATQAQRSGGYTPGDGRNVKKWPMGRAATGKREPQTHQLSRLVREIIWRYEPSRVVVKPRKHRLLVDDVAHLSLDGRTRAILERQAARSFGGNKAAALRAMLIECQGFRRAFTGRAR